MSLMQDLSKSVGYVVREVETKVEDFDGAALADAKRLLADAERAESQAVLAVDSFKGEVVALIKQHGPEAEAIAEEVRADIDKLVESIRAVFGIG